MKFIAKLAIAAFAVVAMASSAFAQANSAAQAEVTKAVQDLVAAYGGGPATLDTYFSFYADDITMVRAQGRQTKQEYMGRWRQLNAAGGGVASASVRDLQVQMLGDRAAATTFQMPVTRRGPLQPGQDRDIVWLMSGTWVKQPDNKWQVKSLTYMIQTPATQPAGGAAPAAR